MGKKLFFVTLAALAIIILISVLGGKRIGNLPVAFGIVVSSAVVSLAMAECYYIPRRYLGNLFPAPIAMIRIGTVGPVFMALVLMIAMIIAFSYAILAAIGAMVGWCWVTLLTPGPQKPTH